MAHTDFNDRIARINANRPPAPAPEGAPPSPPPPTAAAAEKTTPSWHIVAGVFLGLVLVPLAFAARVDTQIVLEPDFGPDAYYYFTAMSFAAGFHLLMFSLIIVVVAHRFKRMFLNIIVLEMLIGYGLASVMFGTIIH